LTEEGQGSPPAPSRNWWLRLQMGLALAGGVVWAGGGALSSEFGSGVGVGILLAALVVSVGRRRAEGPRGG